MSLKADGGAIKVRLRTLTPNFKEYQVRVDGGSWTSCGEEFAWTLRPGPNRLEAKTVNKFGVEGPVSTIDVE